jgi:hypothetical protein
MRRCSAAEEIFDGQETRRMLPRRKGGMFSAAGVVALRVD